MKKWLGTVLLATALALPGWAQISVEQEVALGRKAAQQVEAESGLDSSPELNQRLQRIAQALIPVCGRNDIQYQFKVLNSDEFNAMALPGGFVYATRKLMNVMPDGQLAFVLGHELSHVTRRHSIRQMENDQLRRIGLMAILVGLGGGNVSQESAQLAGVVDQVISSRYSQADEDEADRLGTQMMARAGIDPAYALLALNTLSAQHDGGMPQFVNAILGSHPLPRERIEAAYSYIPPLAYSPGPALSRPVTPSATGLTQWQANLTQALIQSGLRQNAQWMEVARREVDSLQLDASGLLLVCPAGESYNQMERRLYTQELAWLLATPSSQVRQFGVAVGQNSAGERLIWLKVR
jgi:predicted Zn-dependent protease